MDLDTARQNIGTAVVYKPHPAAPEEHGLISDVNDRYVMVRFVGDMRSKACDPADLELRWRSGD